MILVLVVVYIPSFTGLVGFTDVKTFGGIILDQVWSGKGRIGRSLS